jgi:hypothetical protein
MTLRLLWTSRGSDPASLRPGSDVVLNVAPEHALALVDGVAIDDYLDQQQRIAVDRGAWMSLATWRSDRAEDLIVDGADLGHIAEVELVAQCFLPAERLRRGLATIDAVGQIEAVGFDAPSLAALSGLAPASCTIIGEPAPPPAPQAWAGGKAALAGLAAHAGVRPWVRGEVICVSYWHLTSVFRTLVRRRSGPRPVPAGLGLAGLTTRELATTLGRAGWGGSPSNRARAHARARVVSRFAPLLPRSGMDRWACHVALGVAGGAPADLAHARRMLSRRARLVVTPFDSTAHQRPLLAAARQLGVPSLIVQHGFDAGLGDPDKTTADHVAVWSRREQEDLQDVARGSITITGNPGADKLRSRPGRRAFDRTVILVEYPGRLSAQVDQRVGLRHVATALTGLAQARPRTTAIIRPHPSDTRVHLYLQALAGRGDGLRQIVDSMTPIERLFDDVELCIGAISTATLQSAASGLTTIFLDVSGAWRPWPFAGGSDGLPVAHTAGELASLISEAQTWTEPLGTAAAREALGVTGSSTQQVVGLVDHLASRRSP